jgi:hypothetical protein
MGTSGKHKSFSEHRCGECARFKVPDAGCPYFDDFFEYVDGRSLTDMTAKSPACTSFYLGKLKSSNNESAEDKLSQAARIVQLALKHIKVFHDESQRGYARVSHSQATSIHALRSRDFKVWLAGELWNEEQKAPTAENLNSAINVLESQALFKGPLHRLYNRVAPDPDGNGIWIDMCNDNWQAIHVTSQGWRIVDNPPILFRRYSHQQPLPTPAPGGDPNLLFKYVNLAKDDENNRTLLLTSNIHYLIPKIPHVILILFGPQGSAKTTLLKLIRRTIDPSSVEVLSLPRDERELVQQLSHHYCAFYDNTGSLPHWISNVLCRAVTGTGFTKRELYTDDDDIVYSFHRCIGLNDINIAAQRPDALDRAVLIGLKHIPNKDRKTEEAFWREFNQDVGKILGGFLDVLAKAIRIYPTIELEGLHRMADYVKWGCAISEALGIKKEKFLAAYDANVEFHTEEAARSSPIVEVFVKFMVGKPAWEGSPSELYDKLCEKAKQLNISTRQKAWPKAPNILIRRINELVPALTQLGYEVAETREGRTRKVCINTVTTVTEEKINENDGKTSDDTSKQVPSPSQIPSRESNGKTPSIDDSDGSDDIFHTSSSGSEFDLNSSVTESNVLAWLRMDWKGGTEAEFDKLLKSQGYTAEQASLLRQKWLSQGLLREHSGRMVWVDSKTKWRQLSSGDMVKLLRNAFSQKFVEVEFLKYVVDNGWTQGDGESLLKTLEKDGSIFKTGEGTWVWA